MTRRRLLLWLAIILLASGVFLFTNATIIPRQTRWSSSTSTSVGSVSGQYFQYGGMTLTPDNPPLFVVGTSGVGDVIVLNTPWQDFNQWVCHNMPTPQLAPGYTWDCASFGGGDINVTIVYSYLQTHKSQILFSQTIVDQNITLIYAVTTPTQITVVLAPLRTDVARVYWQLTRSNQTTTYPLLGLTETKGSIWNLSNVSLTLVAISGITLLVTLTQVKGPVPAQSRPYREPSAKRCPACGHENLFFAKECAHCGAVLPDKTLTVNAASHAN